MKKIILSSSIMLISAVQGNVYAQDAFDPKGTYLFGDWDRKRTELAEKGIKFDANAALDIAYLADGGFDAHRAPTYASQFWLGSTFDMNQLAGWNGTTIRALITARQGQSTTLDAVQDPMAPQFANAQANWGRGNVDSRLSELSIEKKFEQQGVSIKAGRMGIGTDFNVMACDFQSTAFCAAQMGKWQGKIWMNTPVSQWGARIKYQIQPELFAQVGVYEYNPENALEKHGWNFDTKHADGVTIPVEVVWSPKQGLFDLAGSYRAGMIYNTADKPENQYDVGFAPKTVGEDHTVGGWLNFEQQLTSTGAGRQGLHSFGNFTFHDRTTTQVSDSQQFGLKYIGWFDGQPNDIVGLAVNRVGINNRYRDYVNSVRQGTGKTQLDQSAEYNIELNYSYFPTQWLMLRPVLQYVVHPGATSQVDDALVLGFSSKVIF